MAIPIVDISGWIEKRDLVDKQGRFAIAVALTRTAKDAQKETTRQMPNIFDRPTKQTQNATGITSATKAKLFSFVFLKDLGPVKPVRWLGIQTVGGMQRPRQGKPIMVPEGVRLNRLGNLTRSTVKNLLLKRNVFATDGEGSRLKPGIYEGPRRRNRTNQRKSTARKRKRRARMAKPLKLLLSFGKKRRQRRTFPFPKIVAGVARSKFRKNFERAFADAMRTAR